MDIERGIIKSLFYDYPIEKMKALVLREEDGGFWNLLVEPLPDLMKLRMPHFDGKELKHAIAEMGRECQNQSGDYAEDSWPFIYLSQTAELMLTFERKRPVVKFNELLRWRTLTLYVGEDLITLPWLAMKEKNSSSDRTDYAWKDTLSIDGKSRKSLIGNQPLTDLHAHLGHSSDAFGIRWVYWMNNCWKQTNKENFGDLECVAAIIRYYLFRIAKGDNMPSKSNVSDIIDALEGGEQLLSLKKDIYKKVGSATDNSMKPNIDGFAHWDYAIEDTWDLTESVQASPYMMLAGERYIIYAFFKRLFNKERDATRFAKLFYLYTLIKLNCRKNFIQTNDLIGLSNYQEYEEAERKNGMDHLGEVKRRYAVQSALGTRMTNYLETRISPRYSDKKTDDESVLADIRIEVPIFGKIRHDKKALLDKVRMVVTNSKRKYNRHHREDYIQMMKTNIDEIIDRASRNKRLRKKDFSLVGIDFSSSDEFARPEVYAQLIRYARKRNFYKFTYHAGEDFYDLIDGLRTIEEILVFLKWDRHCRLGHAISLGIAPSSYYQDRGRNVIITRQVLLDNLAWLLSKKQELGFALPGAAERTIKDKIEKLYRDIGYGTTFRLDVYQNSMKLRGDHPAMGMRSKDIQLFANCALDDDMSVVQLRGNADVMAMFKEYYSNTDIYDKGKEIIHWKMPKGIEGGLCRIQDNLLSTIEDRKISIETCPTSNFMIGPFERYDQLPLLKFLDNLNDCNISINTDDKGIIATSIEAEYALIAAAMKKNGADNNTIADNLKKIISGAKKSRFGI